MHPVSRMMWVVRLVLVLALGGLTLVRAQKPSEKPLFDAAVSALQDGFYRRAEQDFSDFLKNYPQSERATEAALLQLHARGEALLKEEAYVDAKSVFEKLISTYPTSSRRLDAVLGLGWAQYRLNDGRGAFALLVKPENGLLGAGEVLGTDLRVVRGCLLLAEVALSLGESARVEEALGRIKALELSPVLAWQRQFLMVRAALVKGDVKVAFEVSSNLVSMARALPGGRSLGESSMLRAEVLVRRESFAEALGALEQNFSTNVPVGLRRRAMERSVELLKTRLGVDEAVMRLEGILKTGPGDSVVDMARLAMGELMMRRFYALGEAMRLGVGTNQLAQARAHLELLVLQQPKSDLMGLAHYHLGWGWWEEASLLNQLEKIRGAETNFDAALRLLSRSEEQMIARFKLADSLLMRGEYLMAATNYLRVVAEYPEWTTTKLAPHDQALYQLARAWVGLRDLEQAREASRLLNQRFPGSTFGERSLLLVAQEMNRQSPPGDARALFEQLVQSFPSSASLPDALLGIARTYEREERWTNALEGYRTWLTLYTNHPSTAWVEYYRALATANSGTASNAFPLFTNFLARFPVHEFAPRAQNWIADYYFERGEYVPAEQSYQRLYSNTNWTELELMYRARYWAARASFLRQGFKQSREQLLDLINLMNDRNNPATNAPRNLLEEAWFLLGDTLSTEADLGHSSEGFQEAINAFTRVQGKSYLAPRALGRIAGCYLAMATGGVGVGGTNRFGDAAKYFREAMSAPSADLATRSLAEFGLGQALQEFSKVVEKREGERLLRDALGHYLQVFYEKNRLEGEAPYPYAVAQSGIAAVNAAEALGRTSEAASLARRLIATFPVLRPRYEERLKSLEQQVVGR